MERNADAYKNRDALCGANSTRAVRGHALAQSARLLFSAGNAATPGAAPERRRKGLTSQGSPSGYRSQSRRDAGLPRLTHLSGPTADTLYATSPERGRAVRCGRPAKSREETPKEGSDQAGSRMLAYANKLRGRYGVLRMRRVGLASFVVLPGSTSGGIVHEIVGGNFTVGGGLDLWQEVPAGPSGRWRPVLSRQDSRQRAAVAANSRCRLLVGEIFALDPG